MSVYVQSKFWSAKILSLCGTIKWKLDGMEFSTKTKFRRKRHHITCSKICQCNVHHVVVKTFQGSQFLRCDCYLYERWVPCCTWIHLVDEFIYTWIHLSRAIINKWIHLLMLSWVRWIHVYEESRLTYLPTY